MPIEKKILIEAGIAIAIFAVLMGLGIGRAASVEKRKEPKPPPELPDRIVFNFGAPSSGTAQRFACVYWHLTGGLRGRLRRLAKLLHLK